MKLPQQVKANVLSIASQFANSLFTLVTFPIIARLLTTEQMGIWALYITMTVLAEMSRSGFIQNGLIKFIQECPSQFPRIVSSGYLFSLLVTISIDVILIIISIPLSIFWGVSIFPMLMIAYSGFSFISAAQRYWESIHIGYQNFKATFISNVTFGLTYSGFIIWCWRSPQILNLYSLILFQSIAALLSLVVTAWLGRKYGKWGKAKPIWIKRLFHFGKYVFGTNASSMLLHRVDVIMLGFWFNPSIVAIYAIATKVNNYMEVPLSGVARVVYPNIIKANKKCMECVARTYEQAVGLLLTMIIPIVIVVALFADKLILLLAGPNYGEATPILYIFLISIIFKPWGRIFGVSLDAIGKPEINFRHLINTLILNVLLNAICISLFGLIGAAIATTSTVIIMSMIGQKMIIRILPIYLSRPFRYIWVNYAKLIRTVFKKSTLQAS